MKSVDLSGLDNFNVSDLMSEKPLETAGKALMIPLEKIVEDAQVRKKMDPEALKELATSIREHGVKSPISVRSADGDGNYKINYGHRRFRASKMAGKTAIPAFIDDEHTDFHQVIENIHREELTPVEIAHFIQRRLEAGDKKSDIAKTLGKPASYVSDHAAMLEMAPEILDLYEAGTCRSVQVLANLHRAHKKHPEKVETFCRKVQGDLTAAQVRAFTDKLKQPVENQQEAKSPAAEKRQPGQAAPGKPANKTEEVNQIPVDQEEKQAPAITGTASTGESSEEQPSQISVEDQEAGDHLRNPVVLVRHNNRHARLLLNRRPEGPGRAWLKYDDDGAEIEAEMNEVELLAIIEG
jgi:ParB family chromosome partitioning protein